MLVGREYIYLAYVSGQVSAWQNHPMRALMLGIRVTELFLEQK